jgi:hypothetical protein
MSRLVALAALVCFSGEGTAQTFKCADSRERITYSNERCEKQGLKDAGAVRDRLTVLPGGDTKPPAKSEAPQPAAKPINPITEKLAK